MSESFIPASEFETASNAVSNILGQPVEEIKITDILPPLNDIADSKRMHNESKEILDRNTAWIENCDSKTSIFFLGGALAL